MPSLNLDLNYFDHTKTMRLEARLGNGADVLPIRLWAYVGRLSPELGRVALLEAELERICRWWGKKGEMVNAMIEIGFIEKCGEDYQIHDWLDHSGHLANFKKRAIKAARKRWGIKNKRSNASSNASDKSKQCPSSAVHSSTVQSRIISSVPKHFIPPSAQEVTEYARSIGFELDGHYFVDRNAVAGWVYGKQRHPIKDWKAVVRTWKSNQAKFEKENQRVGASPDGRQSIFEQVPLARPERQVKSL